MLRVSANACKQEYGDGKAWRLARSEVIKLTCPNCGAKGRFSYHSHYFKNNTCMERGTVKDSRIPRERLLCSSCKTTHAVISYESVPRQSYSLRFILDILSTWACGLYSSIERLCGAYLISINTFYRLKRRFSRHIRLLLGASASDDAWHEWLAHSKGLSIFSLERICVDFHRAFGVTLLEPRRRITPKSANAP